MPQQFKHLESDQLPWPELELEDANDVDVAFIPFEDGSWPKVKPRINNILNPNMWYSDMPGDAVFPLLYDVIGFQDGQTFCHRRFQIQPPQHREMISQTKVAIGSVKDFEYEITCRDFDYRLRPYNICNGRLYSATVTAGPDQNAILSSPLGWNDGGTGSEWHVTILKLLQHGYYSGSFCPIASRITYGCKSVDHIDKHNAIHVLRLRPVV